ncbi:MAG: AI-2E family transporter [Tissierellia bacterium]|nr:AI-2E family transporter [Tissierellia bacterium]
MEQLSGNTEKFIYSAILVLGIILLFLTIYYLINIGNRYIARDKRLGIDLKLVLKIFAGIIIYYLLRVIFRRYPILGYTLWSVIIAIIFAYVIDPLVNYLEKKGIKRPYGVFIVYISAFLIFGILIVSVIPKTIEEITNLLTNLPGIVDNISESLQTFANRISEDYHFDLMSMLQDAMGPTNSTIDSANGGISPNTGDAISNIIINFQTQALAKLRTIVTRLYGVVTGFVKIILVLIFSFYFSVDKDKFMNMVRRNIPLKLRDDIFYLSHRIDNSLQQFIRGRLLMAVFVGFATMVYLLVLRVDFAIVIGLITCVADIIPYIGPFMGFVPAVLFSFMDSPIKALWVAILFFLLQWAENNILAPKLIGTSTGLNPLLVLISIIIGGGVFGVWGMIVSVPLASIIIILIDFFKMKYNEKNAHN